MQTVKDGIITADASGKILMVNKEVERIVQYNSAELEGQSLRLLLSTAYKEQFDAYLEQQLKEENSEIVSRPIVIDGKRKDNSLFSLEFTTSKLEFEGMQLFTFVIRDITERLQVEKILNHSKEELENRTLQLEKAQKELKLTIDELKESNQELERFAYIASHDLQEPLRTVNSYVQLIQKEIDPAIGPEFMEYLSFATDGVKRMQNLIQDLLEYSRVGRNEHRLSLVNLTEVVEYITLNLGEVIKKSEAKIIITSDISVTADRAQFRQLLQNLISNSIKFRKKDEAPEIHISCEATDKEWYFQLKDNGIGINPKHREEIFVIFQRLHARSDFSGTGIGLAICKKIVERHGGKIWVESELDSGATFHFTIAKDMSN